MGKGWTQKMEKLSGIIMDSPSLVFDRCPKVGQEMPRGIKKRSLHAPATAASSVGQLHC